MKLTKLIAAFLLMVIAGSNLTAQTQNSNQRKHIRQGIKSGELTKSETAVLVHQQKDIRTAKHQARADGKVTWDERKDINKDERKASKRIARKKHNKRDRN